LHHGVKRPRAHHPFFLGVGGGGARAGFFGLALEAKDIVFRFIIEYSSSRDFGP